MTKPILTFWYKPIMLLNKNGEYELGADPFGRYEKQFYEEYYYEDLMEEMELYYEDETSCDFYESGESEQIKVEIIEDGIHYYWRKWFEKEQAKKIKQKKNKKRKLVIVEKLK